MSVVVTCGLPSSPAGLEFLQSIQSCGMRLVVLGSSDLEKQIVKEKIPHLHYNSPEEVQQLMMADVQLVVAFPPSSTSTESVDLQALKSWGLGCQAFVRSAAFAFNKIAVIIANASTDFTILEQKIAANGQVAFTAPERKKLAEKAFRAFAELDSLAAEHLFSENSATLDHVVLLVGNGGREHAIAWKLAQSSQCSKVYVAPGNGGTASSTCKKISNVAIDINEHEKLISFAKDNGVTLCVIGPEAPLIDGLADKLNAAGFPTFGPSAKAAQLEGSKAFSKHFMTRHNVPTAEYKVFTEFEAAKKYVECIEHKIVVKASGIAAGKGVLIPTSTEEAIADLKDIMVQKSFGSAGDEVVIEEFLEGEEVSLLAFCDGSTVVAMPGAQDHKRIFEHDQGGNTGGMGAYAPAPCLTIALREQCIAILNTVIQSMAKENMPYIGILYAGFILTKRGPKVLEFNCRFGDPETQVLLPLLSTDLITVFESCINCTLSKTQVLFQSKFASTIVLASEGYPNSYAKNKVITGELVRKPNSKPNVHLFQAGTKVNADNQLVTNGGRVVAVTGTGNTLQEALRKNYAALSGIQFEGMQYRKDIGRKALLKQCPKLKIGVMGSTRGSTMEYIMSYIRNNNLNASIELVISNKSKAGILERAANNNFESKFVSSLNKTREEYDLEVSNIFRSKKIDLVLLIGYMKILTPAFCAQWENAILNVHPSLLPEFAGEMDLKVHEAVLQAKKNESGCTVHYVTEHVDAGPIAAQLKCSVAADDTPESLKAKVQKLEGIAFLYAIQQFQANGLVFPSKNGNKEMITYADAGVSIDAGNELVDVIKPYCKSTRRVGCDADLGGFGGLFDLQAAGYGENTVLVGCTDGVGTKLKIAHAINKHDTIGIDLVAMCVNDLIVQGAEPLFFLDYYACGALEVNSAADVVKGIAEGCRQSSCGLIGGETAEMPSMYKVGDYDLAGFCVGAVNKNDILPDPVQIGDVCLGLYSSGVHSNGFSLVRKLVEVSQLQYTDPCPFDDSLTLGDALLTPTRIYVKELLPILKNHKGSIRALAHITGGGLLENIPRVFTDDCAIEIDCSSWELLPVFKWLREVGNIPDSEMARTFNCGIGMVLVVPPENEKLVRKMLQDIGEKVISLGKIVPRVANKEQVLLKGPLQ